jgi:hypothetical protein
MMWKLKRCKVDANTIPKKSTTNKSKMNQLQTSNRSLLAAKKSGTEKAY